jgi:hypothetical protein
VFDRQDAPGSEWFQNPPLGFALIGVIAVILAVVVTRSLRESKTFLKNARNSVPTEPVLARSSAAELTDAGAFDWSSVLQALRVPPDQEVPDRTGEDVFGSGLGLRTIVVTGGAYQPNVLFGSRHGRCVEIRLGHDEKIATVNTGMRHLREITIVGAHCPVFALLGSDGRLAPEADAPPEALEVLAALSPAVVWNDVRIVAGDHGLVANRAMRGGPYGWVYDLWLLERLADHLKARPRPATKRWPRAKVPYGMGTWTG